jgi:hypothetical protein
MAFLASLRAAYADATSRASQLKKLAQDTNTQLAAGNTSANVIKQILEYCQQAKAANQATAAMTGIVAHARAQEGDVNYDVAAQWTAMNAAIDAVITQVLADVPTGAGGFRLVETWTAGGVSVRTFTPAQTATLRARLADLIATID